MSSKIPTQNSTVASITLTAEDILSGGDLERLEIPLDVYSKNGQAGVVYIRPIATSVMIDFQTMQEKGDTERHNSLLSMIAECVVDESGNPLFNGEQVNRLARMSFKLYNFLATEIMSRVSMGDVSAEGEASSEAEVSDSTPTVSHEN